MVAVDSMMTKAQLKAYSEEMRYNYQNCRIPALVKTFKDEYETSMLILLAEPVDCSQCCRQNDCDPNEDACRFKAMTVIE